MNQATLLRAGRSLNAEGAKSSQRTQRGKPILSVFLCVLCAISALFAFKKLMRTSHVTPKGANA